MLRRKEGVQRIDRILRKEVIRRREQTIDPNRLTQG
jgi:hypothetical protein